MNQAVSLQDAKDRNFAGCATTPFALAPAAEVALIQFDFSSQEDICTIGMMKNRHPDGVHCAIDGPIRQVHLLGHLPDGDL